MDKTPDYEFGKEGSNPSKYGGEADRGTRPWGGDPENPPLRGVDPGEPARGAGTRGDALTRGRGQLLYP